MANLFHIIADPEKVITVNRWVLKLGSRIIINSFAIDAMDFFKKIKMVSRYIKTFGKVSTFFLRTGLDIVSIKPIFKR